MNNKNGKITIGAIKNEEMGFLRDNRSRFCIFSPRDGCSVWNSTWGNPNRANFLWRESLLDSKRRHGAWSICLWMRWFSVERCPALLARKQPTIWWAVYRWWRHSMLRCVLRKCPNQNSHPPEHWCRPPINSHCVHTPTIAAPGDLFDDECASKSRTNWWMNCYAYLTRMEVPSTTLSA